MKTSLSFLFFLLAAAFIDVKACSCSNVPDNFSLHIRVDHVIFQGTVLEQIEFDNEAGLLYEFYGLTKFKVDKWYQNQMVSDTIYYANGQGAMCMNSMVRLKEGDQVIVKAINRPFNDIVYEVDPGYNPHFYKAVLEYKNKPMVEYNICDVSVLSVRDNMVVGNITRNYCNRKLRQSIFVKRFSKKWAEKIKDKLRNTKSIYQIWSFDKFDKLMTAKWNAI